MFNLSIAVLFTLKAVCNILILELCQLVCGQFRQERKVLWIMKYIIALIAVTITVIIAKIVISRHVWKCSECDHRFKVKWYWGASLSFHNGDKRVLKCPKCKKPTWCKIDDNDTVETDDII